MILKSEKIPSDVQIAAIKKMHGGESLAHYEDKFHLVHLDTNDNEISKFYFIVARNNERVIMASHSFKEISKRFFAMMENSQVEDKNHLFKKATTARVNYQSHSLM